MIRFFIMLGFVLMFGLIHAEGKLNMYINTRYAYLSITAIAILSLLCLVEVVRQYRLEQADKRRDAEAAAKAANRLPPASSGEDRRPHDHAHGSHAHSHAHPQTHEDHVHHAVDDFMTHTHESPSRFKRFVGYAILLIPVATGIFLPVQTLDSSFVKAKGFNFPGLDQSIAGDSPGQHQFLRPDTSVFYGPEGYDRIKNKELAEFQGLKDIVLNDGNYMKGMEVIYNYPGEFMNRTISFNGFIYQGEQAEGDRYFVFRFGFIHCAADSGVFGMLVRFPDGTRLSDDEWVHVTGKLTSELYQPFKQEIPVLRVTSWRTIDTPEDPYVYRIF